LAVAGSAAVLAAGTIISAGGTIRGLTTGVGMWLTGAVGPACGAGAYFHAANVVLPGILILRAFGALERMDLRGGDTSKDGEPSNDEGTD